MPEIEASLHQVNETFNDERYARCLELTRELKRALLAEPLPDPLSLGWARFYEFKSLYQLGEHQQAYELLESNEPAAYAVTRKNAAYMVSVGSELAMHLGRPGDVVRWGKRCLELRLEGEDLLGAVQCANTVCILLQRMGRDELNSRFASFLLDTGREHAVERPLIAGVRFLASNVDQSRDEERAHIATAAITELEAIDDARYQAEARQAVERVQQSAWYSG